MCAVGDEKNAVGPHGKSLESRLCSASGEVHQAMLVTWWHWHISYTLLRNRGKYISAYTAAASSRSIDGGGGGSSTTSSSSSSSGGGGGVWMSAGWP